MDIQWYPGHMAKTRKLLLENVTLVDIIIELLDARIPKSSQNPDFESIFNQKKRIKALNKSDLADREVLNLWKQSYKAQGIACVFINSSTGTGFKELLSEMEHMLKEKFERDAKRGIRKRPIRAMVVGIPNVGKSTFINKICGRASTKTGDKPGVTKSKQWIRLDSHIHLLDTPGILWPKFEYDETGYNLAFTGAIKDEIMDTQGLAEKLLDKLKTDYMGNIMERYRVSMEGKNGREMLEAIAFERNYLLKQGQPDLFKTSQILLDEFRGGRMGAISLERP
ncbi:MAG: ribosome biogenesis GTPase YlqF [Clostridia bacterium]